MPDRAPQQSNREPAVELLILPYDSMRGRSLAHVLIEELQSGRWNRFQCAVAFISDSGNFEDFLNALVTFARSGRTVDMTFGADSFSPDSRGSDYRGIERLLQKLVDAPAVKVHLYHEQGRTFHPKLYLFSDDAGSRALLIVGSSNWSRGGLEQNVEANLMVRLNLGQQDHRQCFDRAQCCFAEYWSET